MHSSFDLRVSFCLRVSFDCVCSFAEWAPSSAFFSYRFWCWVSCTWYCHVGILTLSFNFNVKRYGIFRPSAIPCVMILVRTVMMIRIEVMMLVPFWTWSRIMGQLPKIFTSWKTYWMEIIVTMARTCHCQSRWVRLRRHILKHRCKVYQCCRDREVQFFIRVCWWICGLIESFLCRVVWMVISSILFVWRNCED